MRRAISRIICIIVVLALLGLHPSIGAASSVFINIPGITGESPMPRSPFRVSSPSGDQLSGGMNSLERDVFNSATHYSMFLELPGITGEAASPGPAGPMALQSFTLDGQRFSVVRPLDSATPAREEAVANGTVFSTASVFFFDLSNSVSPTATLIFQDVVGSSIYFCSDADCT